jgi:hypothetical protein
MTSRKRLRTAGLLLAAITLSAATLSAERVRNHFDADTMGRAPGFFDFAIVGAPGPARWLILIDENPPSAPNTLQQVDAKRHGQASLARSWEKFTVTASGPELSVLFDDRKLFDATDPKPVSGKTGLATAGPGTAAFDEFILETAEAKP